MFLNEKSYGIIFNNSKDQRISFLWFNIEINICLIIYIVIYYIKYLYNGITRKR